MRNGFSFDNYVCYSRIVNLTVMNVETAGYPAIYLDFISSYNVFERGLLKDNGGEGFKFWWLSNFNNVSGFNITGNEVGMSFGSNIDNNLFYNNFFNNTVNVNSVAGADNYFNTTYSSDTNIMGDAGFGGNYWAYPNGTGYSETCATPTVNDYICDTPLNISNMNACAGCSGYNIDELPLTREAVGVVDNEYPQFSNYWDDNSTLVDSGTGHFNVTLLSTNGTVLMEINNTNLTATNITANVYNVSYAFEVGGVYDYVWHSWGNGTDENFNSSTTQYYTVNISVDNEYPVFSSPTTIPASPVTYVDGAVYKFNITMLSTNGSVGLEFDSVNYTTTNLTATIFNSTVVDLGVKNYTYTWWAYGNGTDNNLNTSITYYYNVTQATSVINLTLNGTQGNASITYGDTLDLNCSTITGEDSAYLELYKGGSLINTGNSPIGNTTTFTSEGAINITCIYKNTQNYSTSSETWWVNVNATSTGILVWNWTLSDFNNQNPNEICFNMFWGQYCINESTYLSGGNSSWNQDHANGLYTSSTNQSIIGLINNQSYLQSLNVFDQDLNTTDSVEFVNINATNNIHAVGNLTVDYLRPISDKTNISAFKLDVWDLTGSGLGTVPLLSPVSDSPFGSEGVGGFGGWTFGLISDKSVTDIIRLSFLSTSFDDAQIVYNATSDTLNFTHAQTYSFDNDVQIIEGLSVGKSLAVGEGFSVLKNQIIFGNLTVYNNTYIYGNIEVDGCISYNCSDSCITLGSCV